MAGRLQQLTSAKAGISRLRVKGGADKETLYDLLNGYVAQDGSLVSRPGTVKDYTLPAGTKGLCAANGRLVVFSDSPKTVPDGVECIVLRHPTSPGLTLHEIHFAGPFLGDANGASLYVVAEFNNGDVYHYWTQSSDTWAADTAYAPGDLVQPSTPNGFLYRATRVGAAYPAWTANTARTEGDKIEPTVANGYYYEATDVSTGGASGTVEPTWPTVEGATVREFTDGGPSGPSTPTEPSNPSGGAPPRYCVVWDSILDDGSRAIDAAVGDLHDCWTPVEGWTRKPILAVGVPHWEPAVRLTLADGSVLRCSATTPFTDPAAATDTQDWLAPSMTGRAAFNRSREALAVVSVEDIGMQWVVPIDFGGRSFGAGDVGLVYSHNINKSHDGAILE